MTTLPVAEGGAVFLATRCELRRHGVEATPAGAMALAVARAMDAGGDSGAGLAALAKALAQVLTEALRQASAPALKVADLKKIRDRKRGRNRT